jgi:hypothetical protein
MSFILSTIKSESPDCSWEEFEEVLCTFWLQPASTIYKAGIINFSFSMYFMFFEHKR